MADGPAQFAARFLRGDHDDALAALRARDADVARETAELIGAQLVRDAREHWNVFPSERMWVDHQRAVVVLAALPGVDERALAQALVDACCFQRVDGHGSALDPPVFTWMMLWASDRIYEAINAPGMARPRFLPEALWSVHDDEARGWMLELFRADPIRAGSMYQDMRVGWHRSAWDAREWSRRVHMLCEAKLDAVPFSVDPDLPAQTSGAQVRLACTYAASGTDYLLRTVAENVRNYRSGMPQRDLGLVWWHGDGVQDELLRTLLEAAGPAGARAPLVDAARDAGLIDDARADFLAAALPHPPWMDGEVPWEPERVVEAGWVDAPDGRVGAADPYWSFEGIRFEAEVPPGRYPVSLTIAIHPLHGRACAIAELVVDREQQPTSWVRLGARDRDDEDFGYTVEVGVGSFGAARALTETPFHELAPPDFHAQRASYAQVDAGELGSIVMFKVLPQHQGCRTWAGWGPDGSVARIVSDLGILHIDPERNPSDPLVPGSPPQGTDDHGGLASLDSDAGAVPGGRYRPADGAPHDTVTVLEVMHPQHSWLRTESVWYRWDQTRVGDVLPASEFRRHFVPA